jgi:hypothetical protein
MRIVALIIAFLAALLAGAGAYDAGYGSGGSGEWAGFGDLFVFVISIGGGLIALLSAIFLKSMSATQRFLCTILALAAVGLPFAMKPLREAKRERRIKEIMNSGVIEKMVKDAPSADR